MSTLIPAPPRQWPGTGARPRLQQRLKAALAALRGQSVILNVALRADVDALGTSRLSLTVGEGFQLHANTYAATNSVLVNGVPLVELDPTAKVIDYPPVG